MRVFKKSSARDLPSCISEYLSFIWFQYFYRTTGNQFSQLKYSSVKFDYLAWLVDQRSLFLQRTVTFGSVILNFYSAISTPR